MRLGISQEVAGRDMDINEQLRDDLAERLGRERFELWVGEYVAFRVAGNTLRVEAETRFRLDRLRRLVHREIQGLVERRFGREMIVEYSTVPGTIVDSVADRPAAVHSNRQVTSVATIKHDAPGPAAVDARGSRSRAADSAPLRVVDGQLLGRSLADVPRRRGRPFARLDQFVVGKSNQLAVRAVEMVAGNLGEVSPLVLFGPSGSGKTHLLEGLWCQSRRDNPMRRAVYLSAEQFTTYFVEALRGSGLASFRRKYRDVDLLLIDDIQFFKGKRATIVELLYTVDQLARDGRQLVVAGDRPPAELIHLGDELATRLSSGLVCGLEPLDAAVGRELGKSWSVERGLGISDEVLELVVRESDGDARRLAGALNLLNVAQQEGQRLSLADAQGLLGHLFPIQTRTIHLSDIERAVCDLFRIAPEQLRSKGRSQQLVQPRMLAMWLARKYTRSALSEIGAFFGRRSHSTVVSAQNKVQRWIEQQRTIQYGESQHSVPRMVAQIEQRLRTEQRLQA